MPHALLDPIFLPVIGLRHLHLLRLRRRQLRRLEERGGRGGRASDAGQRVALAAGLGVAERGVEVAAVAHDAEVVAAAADQARVLSVAVAAGGALLRGEREAHGRVESIDLTEDEQVQRL